MLYGQQILGDIFSSRLPIPKITSWDVEVMKEPVMKPKKDSSWLSAYRTVLDSLQSLKDAINNLFGESDADWEKIASFDSCISVNGVHDSQIVQNTIESSTFRSVNKVRKPSIITVELGKGGYKTLIEEVLERLKKYKGSTTLCRVKTPFGTISNLNLTKLDYSFTRDGGSGLLLAKLTFQEVMFNEPVKKKETMFKQAQSYGKKFLQSK